MSSLFRYAVSLRTAVVVEVAAVALSLRTLGHGLSSVRGCLVGFFVLVARAWASR